MRQIHFLLSGTFWNFVSQLNIFNLRLVESMDVEPVVTLGRRTLVLDSIVGCCPTTGALVLESVQLRSEVFPLCEEQATACVF